MGWHHGWSHSSAVAETAALTASVFGFPFGGGVLVNYLFLFVWLGEAAWWRLDPGWPARRPRVMWGLRAFYFVMILNATVVFTGGMARVAGTILVVALAAIWLVGERERVTQPDHAGGRSSRGGACLP